MQEVSKKEILISIEEQNKIEMLLSRIFEGIRVEVQHEYNNKGFNSDEATIIYRKIYRKMLANSELNSLINKLVEARINNLIKQAGIDDEKLEQIRANLTTLDVPKVAKELDVGELTLQDIIDDLSKPGRDPREEMPKPILRTDVLKFEDLREGMILPGTVRNVTDFGAFVDIGVKHDGLVHISEMSEEYIKNPSDVVSVGDIVKVRVIGIDQERQKVKLSMKL